MSQYRKTLRLSYLKGFYKDFQFMMDLFSQNFPSEMFVRVKSEAATGGVL